MIFSFNQKSERESLEEFNARIKHFCSNSHCMQVESGALGQALIINCHDADDIDIGAGETIDVPLFLPVVFQINDGDAMLEENIAKHIESCEFKSNKDPIVPIGHQIVSGVFLEGIQYGYLVVMCDIGEAEMVGDDDFKADDKEGYSPKG